LAILETREVALSRGESHLETIRTVKELFKRAGEIIFLLGVGEIEIVAVEPGDLAYGPHVGFYDATILTMGARRGFYLVTESGPALLSLRQERRRKGRKRLLMAPRQVLPPRGKETCGNQRPHHHRKVDKRTQS